MDWTIAITRNREALVRILAAIVAMATVGPHPEGPKDGRDPWLAPKADGEHRRTLPRHLYRAVLRLLRPVESAARRLIIIAARGLNVTLPASRPRKPLPRSSIVNAGFGTGIVMPVAPAVSPAPQRRLSLPLLDPLPTPFRTRPFRSGVPRISVPGASVLFPVAPRRLPLPDDLIDAARIGLRIRALNDVLDNLSAHATRFARWRARRLAQAGAAVGPASFRRLRPLRPGRPPGIPRRRPGGLHGVAHDLLTELQGLAVWVLDSPDTS